MAFSRLVESWRPLLAQAAPDIPIEILLGWIELESSGNPCSFTCLRESGIFQVHPDEASDLGFTDQFDRFRIGCPVVDLSDLQARCAARESIRDLEIPTGSADNQAQVVLGLKMVNHYRARAHADLASVGANWPESTTDFWKLVKLYHALPSMPPKLLKATTGALGHPPASWDEFVAKSTAFPLSFLKPLFGGFAVQVPHFLANSDRVGEAAKFSLASLPGRPRGAVVFAVVAVVALVGVGGYYVWQRRQRARPVARRRLAAAAA